MQHSSHRQVLRNLYILESSEFSQDSKKREKNFNRLCLCKFNKEFPQSSLIYYITSRCGLQFNWLVKVWIEIHWHEI